MLFPERSARSCVRCELAIGNYRRYLAELREYRDSTYDRMAAHFPGGVVLDVDAGVAETGLSLLRFNRSISVVAVESREEFLREAAGRDCGPGAGRLSWRKGDAADLPFEDGAAAGVVSASGLREWARPAQVLADMVRVTRPGGHVFVTDLRRDLHEPTAEIMIRDWRSRRTPQGEWFARYFVDAWRRAYTMAEVGAILKRCGIASCDVEEDGPVTQLIHVRVRAEGVA